MRREQKMGTKKHLSIPRNGDGQREHNKVDRKRITTYSLERSDTGGHIGPRSSPPYMRVSLKPLQPLLAAMSLTSIAHSAPSKSNGKRNPGFASSSLTKLSSDLWVISRLTATHVETPKQAALIHTVRFILPTQKLASLKRKLTKAHPLLSPKHVTKSRLL